MDTGSHLLFGATLAGLAYTDPVVAANPELALTVFVGCLIGSHAPDFDTLTRLKSFSAYVLIHRGVTHSIPALFIWPLLIALPLAWGFGMEGGVNFLHLYGWICAAVVFHVLVDLFNVYGVQVLRPFSAQWHHLDSLALFEPFLWVVHGAGLLLWIATDLPVDRVFEVVYGITLTYIAARFIQQFYIRRMVSKQLDLQGICRIAPSLNWFKWQFSLETGSHFYTGSIACRDVRIEQVYSIDSSHSVIEASKGTDGVRAFLQFTQFVHVCFTEHEGGFEVQWRDSRFRHNRKQPFGADIFLDRNLNVVREKIGWDKK
ncbi:metal-dependent hydrolase [Paenibacillus koleovorans]|uniref:metal-dependent hydrolase n=1 Tax=Paenibacillus koleovorans TaxID=121608 RepID=UPI000FDC03AE|nr:metal-dependent hydrolase [Paenibacillus koleovorans]